MSDATTAVILLAAGGSTRLGRPKQLLTLENIPLIRRAADASMQAGCSPLVVVLGACVHPCIDALAGHSFQTAINVNWSRGIGSSIRCGFAMLKASQQFNLVDRAIVMLCDQPQIDAAVLRSLINKSKTSSTAIIASRFLSPDSTETQGPPICITREMFSAVDLLPDDRGFKFLWAKQPTLMDTLDIPEAAIDIDTTSDVARWLDLGR